MFRVYIDTRSDFAVRNWLQARQIPAPSGKRAWPAGTLRDLLTNRRYIGEIEINKHNKGHADLPDFEAYYVVQAPHRPLIERKLFEQAQMIRNEKAQEFPDNPRTLNKKRHQAEKSNGNTTDIDVKSHGVPKSYAWNKCGRVYPLQGLLFCACCGAPMSPHYVHHKAGGNRRKDCWTG